eukprot:Ihof_evm6s106 gene=Ihof_evmTU6s106
MSVQRVLSYVYQNTTKSSLLAHFRHVNEVFHQDLDLAYILPNIVAMSFPGVGAVTDGFYGNALTDVAAFLNERHGGHMLIFNLSERPYDYSILEGTVVEQGWPDLHAPPLDILFNTIHTAIRWLDDDPKNIIVVHCLAGRGRTGLFISCILLLLQISNTVEEAIGFFADRRYKGRKMRKGWYEIEPSQYLYIKYFAHALTQAQGRPDPYFPLKSLPPTLKLKRVIFRNSRDATLQGDYTPLVTVNTTPAQGRPDRILYSSVLDMFRKYGTTLPTNTKDRTDDELQQDSLLVFEPDTVLRGDIILRCFDVAPEWCDQEPQLNLQWRFQLNTRFINHNECYFLYKKDIDHA